MPTPTLDSGVGFFEMPTPTLDSGVGILEMPTVRFLGPSLTSPSLALRYEWKTGVFTSVSEAYIIQLVMA